jgi:hypothetical protein
MFKSNECTEFVELLTLNKPTGIRNDLTDK